MGVIRRGDALWIRCDPSVGVEPRKTRTCIVVSNDVASAASPMITVIPTLPWKAERANRYYLVDLRPPDWTLTDVRLANCSAVTTYDRNRIVEQAGVVSPRTMEKIDEALRLYLGLGGDVGLEVHEREIEYRSLLRRSRAATGDRRTSPPAGRDG